MGLILYTKQEQWGTGQKQSGGEQKPSPQLSPCCSSLGEGGTSWERAEGDAGGRPGGGQERTCSCAAVVVGGCRGRASGTHVLLTGLGPKRTEGSLLGPAALRETLTYWPSQPTPRQG